MPVLVSYMFDEDMIINKQVIDQTTFSLLLVYGSFQLHQKLQFWSNLPLNIMQSIPCPSNAANEIW